MPTITKYPLDVDFRDSPPQGKITMPFHAEIIRVGLDEEGEPCIWALVEEKWDYKPHRIMLLRDDDELPLKDMRYLGGFLKPEEEQPACSWHLFEY